MIKILGNNWLTNFSVTSGNNKSFGPITISDLYAALKTVKAGKAAKSELEMWIHDNGFLENFPLELVLNQTEAAFPRILNAYNNGVEDFLGKNATFYLWLQQ